MYQLQQNADNARTVRIAKLRRIFKNMRTQYAVYVKFYRNQCNMPERADAMIARWRDAMAKVLGDTAAGLCEEPHEAYYAAAENLMDEVRDRLAAQSCGWEGW